MKKILFLIFTITLVIFATMIKDDEKTLGQTREIIKTLSPTPASTPKKAQNTIAISHNGASYLLYYTRLSGNIIRLIPNFDPTVSAKSIVKDKNCHAASSGGFYTKENTPLGLFTTEYQNLQHEQTVTNLINGFFYIDSFGTPFIHREYPKNAPTILQTGPYFESGNRLSIVNDKQSRRIVMFETTDQKLYLGALTLQKTSASGPFLSEVPPVLFSITEPFQVNKGINLDGGAASYFQDENGFTLSEMTYVGSIICIK